MSIGDVSSDPGSVVLADDERPESEGEQLCLPLENRPLRETIPLPLFKHAPNTPGVYLLKDGQSRVLYVGQSKALRTRLGYYRNAKAERVSRKILKLVTRVREIAWLDCATAEDAQLYELELLRLHQPPFNTVNAHPQMYPFISTRWEGETLRLRRFEGSHPGEPSETIYGAFKNRGAAKRALGSLSRLLWSIHHAVASPHEFPTHLLQTDQRKLLEVSVGAHAGDLQPHLHSYFLGESNDLRPWIERQLPARSGFLRRLFESDLGALEDFFVAGPKRNYDLRIGEGCTAHVIPAADLNERLLRARFAAGAAR